MSGNEVIKVGLTGSPAKLEKSLIVKYPGESPRRSLYLNCTEVVVRNFKLLQQRVGFEKHDVPAKWPGFNYRLDAANGIPVDVRHMVGLLEEVLTVPPPAHTDLVIALDWHSHPPEVWGAPWVHTPAGDLARKKYLRRDHSWRVETIPKAGKKLRDAIDRHPLLAAATAILTVPGSSGTYDSFGEEVARSVATQTGKSLVWTHGGGPRKQKKSNPDLDLTGAFSIGTTLSGPVIVIDDLIQSGTSIGVVALAARMAGADAVYGLTISKTHKS